MTHNMLPMIRGSVRRLRGVAVTLALLALPLPAPVVPAATAAGEISPRLMAQKGDAPDATTPVWIFFRDRGFGSSEAERAAVAALPDRSAGRRAARRHAPTVQDLPVAQAHIAAVEALGARIRHTSRWLNAVSAELPLARLEDVAGLSAVRRIEPVRRHPRRLFDTPDALLDPGLTPERVEERLGEVRDPNLELPTPRAAVAPLTSYPAEEALHYAASFNQSAQIGVLDLHRKGYTGAGVRVLILDTGFRTDHQSTLGRRVIAQQDFVFNDGNVNNEPGDVSSAWGHGTAAWSNLGGFDPGGLVGVAYEAEILLAKTEDVRSELPIEEDNFVAALEWGDTFGVDVVSASLQYLTFDDNSGYAYADLNGDTAVTTIACDLAVQRGIAVVVANGNSGPGSGTIGAPADADSVIAVGAVDSLGTLASFSSRGPTADGRIKPEVTARGRSNYCAVASSNGYGPASGTSFATPLVGGVAALLLEAHPGWTGWDVRSALTSTASHPLTPDNNTGHGLVNARLAADSAPKSPPLVSLPFALIAPARAATVPTAAPELRWESSLPGVPGDPITYTVTLATNAAFTGATDYPAGSDTTWIPPMYLTPGITYYWHVTAQNGAAWERKAYMSSRFTISATADVAESGSAPPAVPLLHAAAPNPFARATELRLSLPATSSADRSTYRVAIFTPEGRAVRTLRDTLWGPAAREERITWDGRDDQGRPVAGGVYFVALDAGGTRRTTKLVVQR